MDDELRPSKQICGASFLRDQNKIGIQIGRGKWHALERGAALLLVQLLQNAIGEFDRANVQPNNLGNYKPRVR